jgi:hypothetical protein
LANETARFDTVTIYNRLGALARPRGGRA